VVKQTLTMTDETGYCCWMTQWSESLTQ